MVVILDNYDSFVFNIARYLAELGAETTVLRNDRTDLGEIMQLAPKAVVVSPGPCAPAQAGISNDVIRALTGTVPILGVCLGHQCIGEVFGGRVTRAKRPLHGQASVIAHSGGRLFAGMPRQFAVGRYHSLIVELDVPKASPLAVTARSEDGEIMALAHRGAPTFGVQFHPESILTEHGYDLLRNFLGVAAEFNA